jgi:hypothetical protein
LSRPRLFGIFTFHLTGRGKSGKLGAILLLDNSGWRHSRIYLAEIRRFKQFTIVCDATT